MLIAARVGRHGGGDTGRRHSPPGIALENSGWTCRRTVTAFTHSSGIDSCAADGLVVAVRDARAVHVSCVSICGIQLHVRDVAAEGHPLARNILSAGNVEKGERALNRAPLLDLIHFGEHYKHLHLSQAGYRSFGDLKHAG